MALFPVLMFASLLQAQPVAEPSCLVDAQPVSLQLQGFVGSAELLGPAHRAPRAIVVLVTGSGPYDMDSTQILDGQPVSTLMRDVAQRLACAGYLTMRYAKRHVVSATEVDAENFAKLTMQDMARDARTAADYAVAHSGSAALPIIYYGWSEGSAVAAAVAAQDQRAEALVVQGSVATDTFAETTSRMFDRTGLPYLQTYTEDGWLDRPALQRASAGPGGPVAKMFTGLILGSPGSNGLNPGIDRDRDGRVNLQSDVAPTIRAWFAPRPRVEGQGIWADGVALPGLGAQIENIRVPVLVLQGGNDGNIDPTLVREFAAEHAGQVTLLFYEDLGHTLGPAASPMEDRYLPPSRPALNDMVDWLDRQIVR